MNCLKHDIKRAEYIKNSSIVKLLTKEQIIDSFQEIIEQKDTIINKLYAIIENANIKAITEINKSNCLVNELYNNFINNEI